MTQDVQTGLADSVELAPLRAKWGWIVVLGVVYLVAGTLALGSVLTATVVSVFFVGIMMIAAGITEVIGAFQIKAWSRFLILLITGTLYILAGLLTFQNPLLAAAVLTFILGAALVILGATKVYLAFSVKQEQSWVWVAISGLITLILGLMILARWPVSSAYILGIFLGVDLILAGAGWIGLGAGLRRANNQQEVATA